MLVQRTKSNRQLQVGLNSLVFFVFFFGFKQVLVTICTFLDTCVSCLV